jgi:hypothetical protein
VIGVTAARDTRRYLAGWRLAKSETLGFSLKLEQVQDYEFRVKFDGPGVADLTLDEPAPLGRGAGPNAARLIGAAVANRLTSSLLFCLLKFRQSPGALRADVRGEIVRNDRGRMRIGSLDVTIHLEVEPGTLQHFDRCLAQFEDFCVVTESLRHGVPVGVRVVDPQGKVLFKGRDGA